MKDAKAIRTVFSSTLAIMVFLALLGITPASAQAVIRVGPTRTYTTIQAGINAAAVGDSIVVDAGTYTEDIAIPDTKQDLELRPDTGAAVTIKGVANVPVASWPLADANIEVLASRAKIHGFTIESPDYAAGFYSSGTIVGATDVEVYENAFKVTPAANSGEISQGFQTYAATAIPGVDISGLSVHDNTFAGLAGAAAGYEGIYLNLDAGSGGVTVTRNQFTGRITRALTTERSSTTISDNSIVNDLAPDPTAETGGYQGINIGGVNAGAMTDVTVSGNTVTGSADGLGFEWGIKLGYQPTSTFTNVSLTYNALSRNTIGVRARFGSAGVVLRSNTIAGNVTFGVQNNDTAQLDATYNWWGDNSGPAPGGTGDAIDGDVVFDPWLKVYNADTLTGIAGFAQQGEFAIPSGASLDNTPFLDVFEEVVLIIQDGVGPHTITMPRGVRIDRTDDVNMDAMAITAGDVDVSSLSGYDETLVPRGALLFGIEGVGLSFSPPITIDLFVGTELNGDTLQLLRSPTGDADWVDTGLDPTSATVAGGACTFDTTLASVFAAFSQEEPTGLLWYLAEGSTGADGNGNFETWVLVQNPGDTTANVTVTYMTPNGAKPGPVLNLEPNSRTSVSVADSVPNEWDVSTKVTSDVPVIAERSVYWHTPTTYRQAAHDSIGVTGAQTEWFLAEGSTGADGNGNFETWVLVQNPGDTTANVTLTYMTPDGEKAGPVLEIDANS
ncbi:MAG: right-handed parallel beta-helix repeat-containing protein, partial [Actinobacteria bacterium]|nr:right-handed parallel beta-helix repeat-containing protein [Actinomycetota bacterium]MBU2689053.1 right-handed parallel beta-helix repeat-containing protein [Actinomycetota bacterium]